MNLKNLMNRTLLPATLAAVLAGTALAQQQAAPATDGQQPPPPPMRHQPNPNRETKRLTRELNLTPDQAAKLEPILANRDQQMEAIRSNGQLSQQDARMQMRALEKSTHDQLASVLTVDQMQQFRQMHQHPRGQQGAPPADQPQGPPPAQPNGQ